MHIVTDISEIVVDKVNKVVSAPCYMLDATIVEVQKNVEAAISSVFALF